MHEIHVRYDELALKSPVVRKQMEFRLVENIRIVLEKNINRKFQIYSNRAWGRIIVSFNPEKNFKRIEIEKIAILIAENVIGISSVSPVIRTSSKIEDIRNVALFLAQNYIKKDSSFAIRAKRIGKHEYSSKDLENIIGSVIYDLYHTNYNIRVDLTNPDYTIFIEVKDNFAFLFDEKLVGYGGLPQGTQGEMYSILRGSLEDAVAAFLICNRGAIVIPVSFILADSLEFSTNSIEIEKQLNIFEKIQPLRKKFYYIINFSKTLTEIKMKRLNCATCDRICIEIINKIMFDKMKNGITLGNSFMTMLKRIPESNVINKMPIYYPLIALDKNELNHPFKDGFVGSFCLENCPGFNNLKKKRIKPLSSREISKIVAKVEYSLIKEH